MLYIEFCMSAVALKEDNVALKDAKHSRRRVCGSRLMRKEQRRLITTTKTSSCCCRTSLAYIVTRGTGIQGLAAE